MEPIVLKCKNEQGENLQAMFLPERGMNLISYKLNDIEVIDQSTKEEFEKHSGGLGAMIGPHFHHRKPHLIGPVDREKFVYTSKSEDPFSHGIARYAPWKTTSTETTIHATLSGKDVWHDTPLSVLEGQNFQMTYDVVLSQTGLELSLSVVSDTDSIIGIHFYYHLPNGKGTVISKVQNIYIVNNERKPLPEEWFNEKGKLRYELSDNTPDFTFFPLNPLEGKIALETNSHTLLTNYSCDCQENSWQLWHPKGASFVCIEPVSAQDPRHPNLSVSSIKIRLEVSSQ